MVTRKMLALFLLQIALIGGLSAMENQPPEQLDDKVEEVEAYWKQLQQQPTFEFQHRFLTESVPSGPVREVLLFRLLKDLGASNVLLREQIESSQGRSNGHNCISGHGLI